MEANDAEIFRLASEKPERSPHAREIIRIAKEKYAGMPFALRWIERPSGALLSTTINQLTMRGIIHKYPFLRDTEKGLISQAEHTVIVADEPIVTTKP
ncbi:MAG: type II methionyl aminopeptidase, partial [Candidatus Aenigmarchaeota archaeon]|nr:type II methionyl aminopeptidase [Candidatus Aenigmarchaeota archaeon]